MFLCKPCHDDNTNPFRIACDFEIPFNRSLGGCEKCGVTNHCVDCKGHNSTLDCINITAGTELTELWRSVDEFFGR